MLASFRFLEEPWIWLLKFSKDRFQFSSGFFSSPKIKIWFQFSHFILGAVLVLDLTVLVPILGLQNSKIQESRLDFFFKNKKPQKIWKFWNIIQKIKKRIAIVRKVIQFILEIFRITK
jgi:hypothetical protein